MANGKVLLAYGAIPVAPARWSGTPPQTITTAAALSAELAAVRRNGYATAVAELEEGLVAVAVAGVRRRPEPASPPCRCPGPAFRMRPESLDELGRLCAGA